METSPEEYRDQIEIWKEKVCTITFGAEPTDATAFGPGEVDASELQRQQGGRFRNR